MRGRPSWAVIHPSTIDTARVSHVPRNALPGDPSPVSVIAVLKPILECVPSQNGLVVDPPQRHNAIVSRSEWYSLPSTSRIDTGPRTRYGPFSRAVIITWVSVMPQPYPLSHQHAHSLARHV